MITKFKNTSGAARYIGYLPAHGKTLADGEIIYIEGDLRAMLGGGRGRYSRATEQAALDYDLANGLCTLNDETDSSQSA